MQMQRAFHRLRIGSHENNYCGIATPVYILHTEVRPVNNALVYQILDEAGRHNGALRLHDPLILCALKETLRADEHNKKYGDAMGCIGCATYNPGKIFEEAPKLFIHLTECRFYKRMIDEA